MAMKIGTETNQGSRNLKMIMKKYINQPLTTPSPHPTKMKNDAIKLKIGQETESSRSHGNLIDFLPLTHAQSSAPQQLAFLTPKEERQFNI